MLKPKYLEQLPDRMVELYAEVEADIIADMARRIGAYGEFIPSAEWQYRKIIEMGNYHSRVTKTLSTMTGKTQREIKRLMEEAGIKALSFDDAVYRAAGLLPPPLSASPALQQMLKTGFDQTNGLFENLTRTTANTSTRQFEYALDRAWLQVSVGAFSPQEAVTMAIKDLALKGLAVVTYASGRTDYMDSAVRRAVLTGLNQTALRLQDARAAEMGCDLVEVTAHAGARPSHAVWQGKIYSRSGTHPKYPSLVKETGYGTGPGLGGWNCRHNMFPFFEGISEPAYTQAELNAMNEPKHEYNGQKLTEYEATQKQRYIERQLRRWKREYKAMDAAGLPTEESAARLAHWQKVQNDFLSQTGLKRQYDREKVVGFGRSEAAKAAAGDRAEYVRKLKEKGLAISVKDVAKHRKLMYTNSPEYELQQKYLRSVDSGMLSPIAGYDKYREYYYRIQNELIGRKTLNGIEITGQSDHFLERVFGTMKDPNTGKPRSGVALEDVADALVNGKEHPVKYTNGRPSQRFEGKGCDVSINPETGKLIQCNPV